MKSIRLGIARPHPSRFVENLRRKLGDGAAGHARTGDGRAGVAPA